MTGWDSGDVQFRAKRGGRLNVLSRPPYFWQKRSESHFFDEFSQNGLVPGRSTGPRPLLVSFFQLHKRKLLA
jgi:hypothetical protein